MKASPRVFGNFLLLAGCILATLILTGFQEPAVQVDPDSVARAIWKPRPGPRWFATICKPGKA